MNEKLGPLLNNFLKREDQNVIFDRAVSGGKINGFLFDCIFLLIFIVLPYILSSFGSLLPSINSSTLYIVNFAILALVYPSGFFLYWKSDKIGLKRNGGIAFFIGLFLVGMLRPILGILVNLGKFDSATTAGIQVVLADLLRIISVVVVLKMSTPMRLDIKYVIKNKLPYLIFWGLLIVAFVYMINPIFIIINSSLNPIKAGAANQDAIESTLSSNTFSKYWLVFTIILVAPIFEEITYRHGIMAIMKTKAMKIIVPILYFAGIHVVRGFADQDFTHIFLYIGASSVLTLSLYVKRNVTYPILGHNILNVISLF